MSQQQTTGTNQTCKWSGRSAEGVTLDCERDAEGDGLCCVHSPMIGMDTLELIEEIEADQGLHGAVLPEMDLSKQVPQLTDNQPLDLTGAKIRHLKLDDATISSAVCLSDANIDEISASNAVVEGGIDASGIQCDSFKASEVDIRGDLNLEDASVNDLLELSESEIECLRATRLTNEGKLRIDDCTFLGQVEIDNVYVKQQATFRYSSFEDRVSAEDTTFVSSLDCTYGDFQSQVSFDYTTFGGPARFGNTRFGPFTTSFRETEFSERAVFTATTSTGTVSFTAIDQKEQIEPAVFEKDVDFDATTLHELSLGGVDASGKVTFREAEIGNINARKMQCETLRFVDAVVDRRCDFSDIEVGILDVLDSRFNGYCKFTDISARGKLSIKQTLFGSDLDVSGGTVIGDASFEESRFAGRSVFNSLRLLSRAFFFGARFEGIASFSETEFHEVAWFSRRGQRDPVPPATFHQEVSFHGAVFSTAVFDEVVFQKSVRFERATFGLSPREVTGEEDSLTLESTIYEDVNAERDRGGQIEFRDDWEPTRPIPDHDSPGKGDSDEGNISPSVWFKGTTFERTASFNEIILTDDFVFEHSSIYHFEFHPEEVREDITVRCGRSDIKSGTITVVAEERTNFELDFSRAKLGDVDLTSDNNRSDVFKWCRIEETQFNGFNFVPHLQELRQLRWEIHHTDQEAEELTYPQDLKQRLSDYLEIVQARRDPKRTPRDLRDRFEQLQTTYQYAKNGANITGQNEPASEFFQREMRHQTRHHVAEGLTPGLRRRQRVGPLLRSAVTFLFGVLSKHGERGNRVVLSSLIIIGFYWGIYLLRSDAGNTWAQKLVFSFGSFAALLTGDIGSNAGELTAFIASTEGFVGALMMALLLFTLTRSIHR